MTRGLILARTAAFALAVACGGESRKPNDESPQSMPDAGESGAPHAGDSGGPGQDGGTGAASDGANGGQPSAGGASNAGLGGTATAGSGAATAGRGGASTGGAANGGASNAGGPTPPTAGADGWTLPADCVTAAPIVGEKHCSADMTCDAGRLSLACTEPSPGLWSCGCTDGDTSAAYEIPDVRGVRNCEVAAKACADPSLLTGDESCVRAPVSDELSCSIEDTCESWHEIDGVRLRTTAVRKRFCEPCPSSGDTEASCCRCTDEPVPSIQNDPDFWIRDIDLWSGCDFLDLLCEAESLEPIGDEICEPVSAMSQVDLGCQVIALCGQPIELDDGTTLTLSEEFVTSCTPADGQAHCRCTSQASAHFELGLSSEATDIATCRAAMGACTGMAPLQSTGARECTQSSADAFASSCVSTLECVEPVTVGGAAANVFRRMGASCEIREGDRWGCTCDVASAESFEVEAVDATSACDLAAERCLMELPSP